MSAPTLHFCIRLDPETAHLDGPLRREIQRRWPFWKEIRRDLIVSTVDLQHAEELFTLEVSGWPAFNQSIRAYLMDLIDNGRWLVP